MFEAIAGSLGAAIGFVAKALWDYFRKKAEEIEKDKYSVIREKLDVIRGEILKRLESLELRISGFMEDFNQFKTGYRKDQARAKGEQEKLIEAVKHVVEKADERYDKISEEFGEVKELVINWKDFKHGK